MDMTIINIGYSITLAVPTKDVSKFLEMLASATWVTPSYKEPPEHPYTEVTRPRISMEQASVTDIGPIRVD